jgi:hypothetical protein
VQLISGLRGASVSVGPCPLNGLQGKYLAINQTNPINMATDTTTRISTNLRLLVISVSMLIDHPARLVNNQLPLSFQFDIMKTLEKDGFLQNSNLPYIQF